MIALVRVCKIGHTPLESDWSGGCTYTLVRLHINTSKASVMVDTVKLSVRSRSFSSASREREAGEGASEFLRFFGS